jgi:hypothetical protein
MISRIEAAAKEAWQVEVFVALPPPHHSLHPVIGWIFRPSLTASRDLSTLSLQRLPLHKTIATTLAFIAYSPSVFNTYW